VRVLISDELCKLFVVKYRTVICSAVQNCCSYLPYQGTNTSCQKIPKAGWEFSLT